MRDHARFLEISVVIIARRNFLGGARACLLSSSFQALVGQNAIVLLSARSFSNRTTNEPPKRAVT